ncbi:MAG: OmpH family outer membrane protein [Desulfosalsimonadaceae bacterium]|uniref:OmpH family outer membrane protein n=1 Tax=Desulfosalsimonas sp. TaxID=3073848 RepID=UPI003970D6C2
MKAIQIFAISMLACLFLAAGPAGAADVAKIGVIDFQKVISESEAGQKVQEEIQKKGRQMESELQEMAKEIEELDKQLSRDAMVMSKEKRQQKQRELEIKKYDLQSRQREYENEFRQMQSERVGELRDDIMELAEQIGKKEGYLLIIEKNAAVYYPSAIDMTDEIIRKYNERNPA